MIRESLDTFESMSTDIKNVEKLFLGNICGIALKKRTPVDNHVMFQLLSEDDGHWFLSTSESSSFWFEDYLKVFRAAILWCKRNCEPDIIENGVQCGWKFKK